MSWSLHFTVDPDCFLDLICLKISLNDLTNHSIVFVAASTIVVIIGPALQKPHNISLHVRDVYRYILDKHPLGSINSSFATAFVYYYARHCLSPCMETSEMTLSQTGYMGVR